MVLRADRKALDTGRYRRERLTETRAKRLRELLEDYNVLRNSYADLEGKVLLFSCCDIGKPSGLAEYVSRISRAKAVITYDGWVSDQTVHVIEPLLYFRLVHHENKRATPAKLVEEVRASVLDEEGNRVPLVCFVNGVRVA